MGETAHPPDARVINPCDYDLAGGKFQQPGKPHILARYEQASRREGYAEPRVPHGAREHIIVACRMQPILANSYTIECIPSDSGRSAPGKISAVIAQSRSH